MDRTTWLLFRLLSVSTHHDNGFSYTQSTPFDAIAPFGMQRRSVVFLQIDWLRSLVGETQTQPFCRTCEPVEKLVSSAMLLPNPRFRPEARLYSVRSSPSSDLSGLGTETPPSPVEIV